MLLIFFFICKFVYKICGFFNVILFLFVCKGVIGLCLLLYGFVKFFISGRVIGKVFNLFKCFMNELGLC